MMVSPAERRRKVALVIRECEGSIVRVAWRLGYHRSHTYRLIKTLKLWPVVNAARLERVKRREE